MENAHEKRQYKRFSSINNLKAIDSENNEVQSESNIVNISEGGLLFYSKSNIEPGEELTICIDIPQFNSSLTAEAKVMWAQKAMEKPGCSFVGVQFVKLDSQERSLIRGMSPGA